MMMSKNISKEGSIMNKNQIKLVITICTIFIVFFPIRSNAKIVVNKYGAYDTDFTYTTTFYNPIKQVEETHTYNGNRIWSGGSFTEGWSQGYSSNSIPVTYEVTYCYDEAYKMIDLVNDFRKSEGKEPVVVNDVMMEIAMERAAQVALYFAHKRPDTLTARATGMFITGENIVSGCTSAEDAIDMWKESKHGHRENMLSSSWKYAGYGLVKVNNEVTGDEGYFNAGVQIFSSMKGGYTPRLENGDVVKGDYINLATTPLSHRQDYTEWYTTDLNPEFISAFASSYSSAENGEWTNDRQEVTQQSKVGTIWEIDAPVLQTTTPETWEYRAWSKQITLQSSQYSVTSSNPDVCKVIDQNTVQAVGNGTATITVTWLQNPQYQSKVKMIVTGAKNSWTIDGITYQITNQKKKTVQVIDAVDDLGYETIPATVKIKGKVYKVTKIASGAFQNNKGVKKITIGKNVTTIGKNAFSGCKELKEVTLGNKVTKIEKNAFSNCKGLKRITVKSKKLNKVEKNAVKGVNKKMWIIVPKSKVKKYRKLFKKSTGYKKSMSIGYMI